MTNILYGGVSMHGTNCTLRNWSCTVQTLWYICRTIADVSSLSIFRLLSYLSWISESHLYNQYWFIKQRNYFKRKFCNIIRKRIPLNYKIISPHTHRSRRHHFSKYQSFCFWIPRRNKHLQNALLTWACFLCTIYIHRMREAYQTYFL